MCVLLCLLNHELSGDNVLTAVSVSKECGLVSPSDRVFVSKLHEESPTQIASVSWEDIDNIDEDTATKVVLDPETFIVS